MRITPVALGEEEGTKLVAVKMLTKKKAKGSWEDASDSNTSFRLSPGADLVVTSSWNEDNVNATGERRENWHNNNNNNI